MAKNECIDLAYGLELWREDGQLFVKFEDDDKGGGTSLMCAFHEEEVYCAETQYVEPLDREQIEQVNTWFHEFEEEEDKPEILWDENAELAYEHGAETARKAGVWVVHYWPDGDDAQTQVFGSELGATTAALGFAMEIWSRHWTEDGDWPIQPERWDQIFAEVLNRAGDCMDILTVEHKEIQE